MTPSDDIELWRRAAALFEATVQQAPQERDRFLRSACGSDSAVRSAVESLLVRDAGAAPSFLETPLARPHQLTTDWSADAWVGRHVGAFELLRPIGAGGMSRVYLGERRADGLQQRVAVKLIPEGAASPALLRSLRREKQILASLQHPNIARFLDGGSTEEKVPYVAMEFIEGTELLASCDARRATVFDRLALFRKICGAVSYAHSRLVVHRDLKPANILITDDGEPKLLDFGVAKLLDSSSTPDGDEPTMTQERFLTPSYASPEQLAGSPVSTASDIYSLGVLLYQLLTGVLPFSPRSRGPSQPEDGPLPATAPSEAATASEAASEHDPTTTADRRAHTRSTTPAQLRRLLRGDLDTIVLRCLRRVPEERYSSVAALEEDVRRHLEGLPVLARAPRLSYRLGKFMRRNAYAVALAGVAVVALLGLLAGTALQNRHVASQREIAERARAEAEEVTTFLVEAFVMSDPFQRRGSTPRKEGEATVTEVLDYSAARVHEELSGQPALQSRLLQTIGTVFGELGRQGEAIEAHRAALEIRRRHQAHEPLVIAESLNGLGLVYGNMGRLSEAVPLFDEALELSLQAGPEGHVQLALSSTNVAMVRMLKGDLDGAEPLFREALALRERLLEPDDYDLEQSRLYLGQLLTRKGALDEAEAIFRFALENCPAQDGDDHARVARIATRLAHLLTQTGRLEEAEALYRRALEIYEHQLGRLHPMTITGLGNFGLLLREKRDYGAAEEIFLEAFRRRRESDAPPAGIANSSNSLGLLRLDQGDPAGAEPYFRQAIEAIRGSADVDPASTSTYLRNLGRSLHDQGDAAAAEPLMREGVAIERRRSSVGLPLAYGLTALASVLVSLGRHQEALGHSLEAEGILVSALPPRHPRSAAARSSRGAALAGLGRFEEAEPLLLESYRVLASEMPGHRVAQRARQHLVQLYELWDRPEDAEAFRADPLATGS